MVLEYFVQHPLLFNIGIMIVSLAILMKAADLLITGSVNYARKFGMADFVVGFIILGIGTSLPEFVAAVMGSTLEDAGVVFGTVLGSAVVTVNLVLGIQTIVAKKLPFESKSLGRLKYLVPAFMLLPILLVLDGLLSRIDGAILLAIFFGYLFILWRREGKTGHMRNVKLKLVWKDIFVYLGALAALLLGARFLVSSAIISSTLMGIPSYVIALFVIGIGASLGDLLVDLRSIKAGHSNVAVGDVLAGLLVETLFILGAVALMKPVAISPAPLFLSAAFAVLPLALLLITTKELRRWHGIALVSSFAVFAVIQIWLLL